MDLQLMSVLFSSEVKNAGFVGLQIIFDKDGKQSITMVEAPDGDFDGLAAHIGKCLRKDNGKGNFDKIYEMLSRIVLEGTKGRHDRMLRLAELIKETYKF